MTPRDHLVVLVNGLRREVRGADCFLSLSDFLRLRLGLVGTKIVCSEGDCGACTVLVGRPQGAEFQYLPIDSCIQFMFQLDGVHVVTVEGLQTDAGELSPIQRAMVDCHGSQCGFCTPGFVVAMTGACEHRTTPLDEHAWRHALTGNLCRCTGYAPILAAGGQVEMEDSPKLNERFPPAPLLEQLAARETALDLRDGDAEVDRRVYCPATLAEAVEFRRAHPEAKIVAGATDVGVQLNKGLLAPRLFLSLSRVAELQGVRLVEAPHGTTIEAGAGATWTQILEVCGDAAPEFAQIIEVFGAPQIRHVGTLGGNLINASPIADSLPFLYVMEAELELTGPNGVRRVDVNRFYRGYKQFDLAADELLTRVRIPLPSADERLRLYKISRRRDLDISTFTAAIRLQLDQERIAKASIAYGAVGPTVLRLRKTESFLTGQPFTEETMRAAGEWAVAEITPISDVRGSADYRRQLARNILLKFYFEQQVALV